MFRRFRSARTGRYTTPADAKSNRDTTISEPMHEHIGVYIPPEALVAVRRSLRVNGLDNTIERLAD